jgi:hypothetical protein
MHQNISLVVQRDQQLPCKAVTCVANAAVLPLNCLSSIAVLAAGMLPSLAACNIIILTANYLRRRYWWRHRDKIAVSVLPHQQHFRLTVLSDVPHRSYVVVCG